MSADDRIRELHLELPPAPKAMGLYQSVLIVDQWAYLSGHGPLLPNGQLITGRIGDDLDQEAGTAAARQTGLAMLASLRKELGTLDRIVQTVKLFGMVNCTATFHQQPAVINGCSQLFADVFGEQRGVGARSAVGVAALPSNMAVEIEALFRIDHAD
jgi:enamine deaminase RidA (YjgF/YER057c/UK114 family)